LKSQIDNRIKQRKIKKFFTASVVMAGFKISLTGILELKIFDGLKP